MKVIKVIKEYYETEDEKVYFFEPLENEISVEDMQKIVDANEKLVKELKNGTNTVSRQKISNNLCRPTLELCLSEKRFKE